MLYLAFRISIDFACENKKYTVLNLVMRIYASIFDDEARLTTIFRLIARLSYTSS